MISLVLSNLLLATKVKVRNVLVWSIHNIYRNKQTKPLLITLNRRESSVVLGITAMVLVLGDIGWDRVCV